LAAFVDVFTLSAAWMAKLLVEALDALMDWR
jgi:hypothetical protein